MKYIVILLSFTLLTACHRGAKIETQSKFTSFFMFYLEKKFPDVQFALNPATGVITAGSQQINTVSLYKRYQASPDSLESLMMISTHQFKVPTHRITSVNLDQVIPVLSAGTLPTSLEQYNDELYVSYAESTPTYFKYLSKQEVEEEQFSLDTLKTHAINNLLDGMSALKTTESGGIYMVGTGDDAVASLILYNPFWDKKPFLVHGDYVVAIPCRGRMFVTGSNDKKGILKIQELAETAFGREAYPITQSLFKYDGKKFLPFIH